MSSIKKTLEISLTFNSDCDKAHLREHVEETLSYLKHTIKSVLDSFSQTAYTNWEKSYKIDINASINKKETTTEQSLNKLLKLLKAKDLKSAINQIEKFEEYERFCDQYK